MAYRSANGPLVPEARSDPAVRPQARAGRPGPRRPNGIMPSQPGMMRGMGGASAATEWPAVDGRPQRVPRPGSISDRVRRWVLDLPDDTMFRTADAPAEPRQAARILCDLSAERLDVERIFKGVYWRGWSEPNVLAAPTERIAMAYAGPGAGYAGPSAVHRLGWTTQWPAKVHICTLGRPPAADHLFVRFTGRSNPARGDLTWAEVTLLEGVLHSERAQPRWDGWTIDENGKTCEVDDWGQAAWDDGIGRLLDGSALRCLGADATIRPAAVAEAAAGELAAPRWLRDRAAELPDRLPPLITWDDHAEPDWLNRPLRIAAAAA